jgi:SAM-dependent methyltransferase
MTKFASTPKRVFKSSPKNLLRQLRTHVLDFSDAVVRHRNMTPPRSMNFVGNGDYEKIGQEFRTLFTQFGGLQPSHRVLDVGCGIGRMAVPLTSYLAADTEYRGFDVVEKGVRWCQKNITPRYPHFQFQHANIENSFYNPHGIYKPSDYKFPYDDSSFDFVFATSVFTHMLPSETENYLAQISRVLKRGGTCFSTFFLMTEEVRGFIEAGSSTQNFIHGMDGYYTTALETPELAIAFRDDYIRDLFAKFGLTISQPIHYGSWCGRPSFLSYQDIVIATKS